MSEETALTNIKATTCQIQHTFSEPCTYVQAHHFFSNLRWVAAGLAVAAAMWAAYSLGGGASFKGLILPALTVLISGALATWSSNIKGRMEFQDYV